MRNRITDSLLAPDDGFSLIELMISLTLVAMILGGMLPLLTGGQNTYQAQSADMSMRQGARVALGTIQPAPPESPPPRGPAAQPSHS